MGVGSLPHPGATRPGEEREKAAKRPVGMTVFVRLKKVRLFLLEMKKPAGGGKKNCIIHFESFIYFKKNLNDLCKRLFHTLQFPFNDASIPEDYNE